MQLTVNGLRYIYCQGCHAPKIESSFEAGNFEKCISCLHPQPSYKPDPIKEACRRATRKAIKEGRLRDEPEACEDCGKTDEDLTVHHRDYSDPLDIEWLCTACHGKRHRGNKRYNAFSSHVEARMAWI